MAGSGLGIHKRGRDRKASENEEDGKEETASSPPAMAKAAQAQPLQTAFTFWAWCAGVVSIVALISLTVWNAVEEVGADADELGRMSSDVRSHYAKGKMVKVEMGCCDGAVEMFVTEQGSEGAEEVVVLVHGLGSNSYSFRHVMKGLSQAGVKAVAVDLPGFGLSQKWCMTTTTTTTTTERRWGGVFGRMADVYADIKEKGLFWGFDQLLETGTMPYQHEQPPAQRGTSSLQPLQCTPYDLSRSLGQAIEAMELRGVHLVVHDAGFEAGALWAASNPSAIKSISILDAAPWQSSSLPLWLLKLPVPIHYKILNKFCCSSSVDDAVARSHAALLQARNGRKAALEIGSRLNASFDVAAWSDLEGLRRMPMQILWAVNWSSSWHHVGQSMAKTLPLAAFVPHFGGRWPQEDAPDEVVMAIMKLVPSMSLTARTETDETLQGI